MTLTTLATWTPEPFELDDTVEHALGQLLDEETGVLPVVDEAGRLVGVVTERVLLEADSPDAPLSSLPLVPPVTISPEAHVFEATKVLVRHDLAAVAVVDETGQYLGFARRHDIFERFAGMLATQDPGAVVSVEVEPRDYALSQLIYAAEQNGVHVRSIVMEPEPMLMPVARDGENEAAPAPDARMRVTLKLDTTDTARVRAVLEHYGYRVVGAYGEREDEEDLQARVHAFMRYLDV
ncbi:MAG TPA: CBS domain-containing protein [Rhodothermales bacterium]|nr:CBS domain-containing protein [Rhodothermales bacterium]